MARFYLEDFNITNNYNGITSVSWEVALDSLFNNIIDSTYKNPDINSWYSSLPNINKDGTHYTETTKLYVRCKIYSETNSTIGYESDWFTITLNDTYVKSVKLRKNGKLIGEVDVHSDGTVENIW